MTEITLDADRRRNGPYTLAADLLGLLVPQAAPELVAAHDIEILAAAPGLRASVPAGRVSPVDRLPQDERILVPGRLRTLRLANGLAEFVRDHLRVRGPLAVRVTNTHEADPTDTELVAVLRRRVPAELLTITLEDPAFVVPGPGGVPVREADLDRYRDEGFHHAMAEAGAALLPTLAEDGEEWWRLLHRTTTALAALDREDEARALLDHARRVSAHPKHRATAAYATAMLLVRHHDPGERDPEAAMAWINEAVALTSLLPDRRERAFHLGFDLNGKALIEVRRGNTEVALRLVQQAIELAERDLAPGRHPVHKAVLRANRAQLTALLGDAEGALADLDAVVAADPGYPDPYLDRGNLLHRLGRLEEALADYETAMRVGPPFPEPYYNRSEIRYARGDLAGALADLDHAIELDPGFTDAYVNRAGLLVALDELDRARADAERDLDNPYLLCVLGQVEAAQGKRVKARKAYDSALRRDPRLAAVWAGRGALAFEEGDHETSIADLTRAIELEESAEALFNRSLALRMTGRAERARADLRRARELAPDDEEVRRALAELG
ncbi:tetratricopeptide repeat protein [Nonomuraea guangzhouensis]|uniref:Tetratricopeptide repeat protein n=1 Tax=Nonomuraea guangzhouensis TaxID=1291555 RepID=A0ABW4G131_9ACTN|nr:tetratricopeptide repeat protein [Nonomuraea guangzhouensis]